MPMTIAMASDHGGYGLKETIKAALIKEGYAIRDFGCFSTESMDYPDTAFPAAEAVASGECERGIVICTTGIGMSISANKVRGIRCALCTDTESARLTREHNDTNVLALGAKNVTEELGLEITRVWLTTDFSGAERHARRVAKITEYENRK